MVSARARRALLSLLVVAFTTAGSIHPAAAQDEPRSIVAIGDSISRATNVCCWYGDHPSFAWATGFNPLDGLHSHYERLLLRDPSIWGNEHNNARGGAKMIDGPAQAETAVSQGADYVTILLGANDVCTSSTVTMTRVDAFKSSFESVMATLHHGLASTAKIFVSSIPNVRRMWTLFHDNVVARYIWRRYNVCQSALSGSSTLDDRRHVYRRTLALNGVLEEVCARYRNCRFDQNAVFRYSFSANQVSRLDYFHPNRNGQKALADLSWAASWWA